jgi:hypothetical protein
MSSNWFDTGKECIDVVEINSIDPTYVSFSTTVIPRLDRGSARIDNKVLINYKIASIALLLFAPMLILCLKYKQVV